MSKEKDSKIGTARKGRRRPLALRFKAQEIKSRVLMLTRHLFVQTGEKGKGEGKDLKHWDKRAVSGKRKKGGLIDIITQVAPKKEDVLYSFIAREKRGGGKRWGTRNYK